MALLTHRRTSASAADRLLYLAGVAGIAACLVLVFMGMRAVLDIGGFCAEGGPYVIETHCPEGVPLLMMLAIPGLFLFGGLMVWSGTAIGAAFQAAVFFAWPALFLSLGWNFLEYGISPPGGGGPAWGWLICGVAFVAMGAVPLWVVLGTEGVIRRPARESLPWLALIVGAVGLGVAAGYGLFRLVAG